MAYIYLLKLYERIDLRLDETKKLLSDKTKAATQIKFLEGSRDILSEFRQFLSDNLDAKLPKRIRKQLFKTD